MKRRHAVRATGETMNRMRRIRKLLWAAAGVAALLLAIALWHERSGEIAPGPPAGAPSIGGPFALVDHTGRAVTDADFRGKYLLVYFGYTYCPDICPTTLQVVTQALDALGVAAAKIQPLLITVDPARDTARVLAAYVRHFHPSLIGLTGTPAQIARAAKAYRIYYARGGDDASDEDYLMDHSSILYLMGPDGGYLTHFTSGIDPDTLAAKLRGYVS